MWIGRKQLSRCSLQFCPCGLGAFRHVSPIRRPEVLLLCAAAGAVVLPAGLWLLKRSLFIEMHLIYDIYIYAWLYICIYAWLYIYIYLPLTEWIMIRSQYGWLTTIIFSTLNPGRQSQFSQTPGMADFNASYSNSWRFLESRIHLGLDGQETCELLLRNLTSGWHWSLKEVETCGDLWRLWIKYAFLSSCL